MCSWYILTKIIKSLDNCMSVLREQNLKLMVYPYQNIQNCRKWYICTGKITLEGHCTPTQKYSKHLNMVCLYIKNKFEWHGTSTLKYSQFLVMVYLYCKNKIRSAWCICTKISKICDYGTSGPKYLKFLIMVHLGDTCETYSL